MLESSHIHFNKENERYENEKPHVTLMNSTFLMQREMKNDLKRQGSTLEKIENKLYFNGIKIIKKMKNFSFGIHKVEEFALNEMKIDRISDSYTVINKFKLI